MYCPFRPIAEDRGVVDKIDHCIMLHLKHEDLKNLVKYILI